jgi:UDP-N-acetylmuramoyl-L-alanyl-D-glutamate--2,6-diaminopimelate ligase
LTPDAVENVLQTIHELRTDGKVITVFGCGGDRDKGKRPLMGRVARKLSDTVIITSDNPRTEEPLAIINEIRVGIKDVAGVEVMPNRKEAIHRALSLCSTGDIVLIAGKGHEDYQIIGKEKIHFDDREVVEEWNKKF